MKIYIKSDTSPSSKYIDMMQSLLGWGYYGHPSIEEITYKNNCNFALSNSMYRFSQDEANKYKSLLKEKLGAKYINPWLSGGKIFFYVDLNQLQNRYDAYLEQKRLAKDAEEAKLMERLNTYDINPYIPDDATIQKLINYRDKGSKVNVKAIKDFNKAVTYYYGARLIGWEALEGDIYDKLCGLGSNYSYSDREANKDLLLAIDKRVAKDPQYEDIRTKFEQKYDLPATNGLFTFDGRDCWLPKSILMYFINNNIPVHFGKRTSGAQWDRNGAQWSEVEHLTLFPDSDSPIEYDIVVHTDEGLNQSNRYTGFGPNGRTDERISAKQLLSDIDKLLN